MSEHYWLVDSSGNVVIATGNRRRVGRRMFLVNADNWLLEIYPTAKAAIDNEYRRRLSDLQVWRIKQYERGDVK
jgi:hypothetical protein